MITCKSKTHALLFKTKVCHRMFLKDVLYKQKYFKIFYPYLIGYYYYVCGE